MSARGARSTTYQAQVRLPASRSHRSLTLLHALRLSGWSLALFALLALLVRYGIIDRLDDRLVVLTQAFAPAWLFDAANFATWVGNFEMEALFVVAAGVSLCVVGRYFAALALAGVFVTTAVEIAVKRFLYFPRSDFVDLLRTHPRDLPEQFNAILPTVEPSGFPSGHAATIHRVDSARQAQHARGPCARCAVDRLG